MDTFDDCIYIDTNPGGRGLFSPPEEVEKYDQWLHDRYKASQRMDGETLTFFGVAQKMNQAILAGRDGHTVRCFGKYAGAAAAVLEKVGGIEVEVLG